MQDKRRAGQHAWLLVQTSIQCSPFAGLPHSDPLTGGDGQRHRYNAWRTAAESWRTVAERLRRSPTDVPLPTCQSPILSWLQCWRAWCSSSSPSWECSCLRGCCGAATMTLWLARCASWACFHCAGTKKFTSACDRGYATAHRSTMPAADLLCRATAWEPLWTLLRAMCCSGSGPTLSTILTMQVR